MAKALGCTLEGNGDLEIFGVAGIDEAQAGQVTFVSNPKYAAKAKTTSASAVIVSSDFQDIPAATLRTGNPYLALHAPLKCSTRFRFPRPNQLVRSDRSSAKIGPGASIGPFAVIEDDVVIGAYCIIYPFVHIYRGARIGDNFKAYAHVSVREFTQIGNGVILQDGVKSERMVTAMPKQDDGSYYKIVQSGIVVLEDNVEVGANSTIDRGTIGETRIRRGAKIDNLVQVGHASEVGENTLLCAQVGLAGSSKSDETSSSPDRWESPDIWKLEMA
jgi:UDP-3-O-[3-hydroxymyristoyl] glucosamine N-acyltransferase